MSAYLKEAGSVRLNSELIIDFSKHNTLVHHSYVMACDQHTHLIFVSMCIKKKESVQYSVSYSS